MSDLRSALEGDKGHLPSCRGCGRPELKLVIDLGRVPLANSLLTEAEIEEPEDRLPLELYFCPECKLVQIGETVVPSRLFEHYLYASSFSESFLRHIERLVERLISERGIGKDCLVIEVASNDGYLLQYYHRRGIPVLGIEPARNIAEIAERERGIPTVVDFFGPALSSRLAAEGRQADIIHAHNVFAHVPRPAEFIAGLKRVLKPDGIVIVEVPYLSELIRNLEFDTIYHEHFSYFSLTAVDRLVRRFDMMVADVETVPVHGGSLRLSLMHEGASPISDRVGKLLAQESKEGVQEWRYYADFARRVHELRTELVGLLRSLKEEGSKIVGYGASAKGSTLMNAFGIGKETLDFVVDRSTLKQGRFTPGNHLPILPTEALVEMRPDYALLLTWNFADEILEQQRRYRQQGGRFIVPLPRVQVL